MLYESQFIELAIWSYGYDEYQETYPYIQLHKHSLEQAYQGSYLVTVYNPMD